MGYLSVHLSIHPLEDIYYKELVPVIMEAEKSPNLQSAQSVPGELVV